MNPLNITVGRKRATNEINIAVCCDSAPDEINRPSDKETRVNKILSNPSNKMLPLIGTIDSARSQQIMEAMLAAISQSDAQALILDVTGVAVIDTNTANYLLQAARAVQLLGAQVLLVGISPEIAQTIVQLGIDLGGLLTQSTLQAGLDYTLKHLVRGQKPHKLNRRNSNVR